MAARAKRLGQTPVGADETGLALRRGRGTEDVLAGPRGGVTEALRVELREAIAIEEAAFHDDHVQAAAAGVGGDLAPEALSAVPQKQGFGQFGEAAQAAIGAGSEYLHRVAQDLQTRLQRGERLFGVGEAAVVAEDSDSLMVLSDGCSEWP